MSFELPNEILVYIFKYLSISDRLAASETCWAWYTAANTYCFVKNKLAEFNKIYLSDDTTTLDIFKSSPTPVQNFIFNNVEISSKLNDFWDTMGKNIKCISFKNCDIHEKEFVYLLEKCKNLQNLQVVGCKELFMMSGLLEAKTEGFLEDGFQSLEGLSLSRNSYLSDALFNRFVKVAPGLVDLNFSYTAVQFHNGLVKKFYPPGTSVFEKPSACVFTFYFILQFIRARAKQIKKLNFSFTLIDGMALISLSEIKNLRLESLQISGGEQIKFDSLKTFLNCQKYITELDISSSTRVTDKTLSVICDNLQDLKSLIIERCPSITDTGAIELGKLKKLKLLNISQCQQITKNAFEKGICKEQNNVLKELDIHCLNLDESGIIAISEKLPQLLCINMNNCVNGVTDKSIQIIFKNQVLLHILRISHCVNVSDAGMTGMVNIETGVDYEGPIMSGNVETNNYNRIGLGSKAEEEIIRDARRKQDVMKMCEKTSVHTSTGYSLARLKGLKALDISGCNRITDVSLTYAFKCEELIFLNVSECQQITVKGIKHLVKYCPSIEYLNFVDCLNINDEGVKTIVCGLKRLKQLQLKGCKQLSDKSVQAIRENCEKIKVIDMQGCRKVSSQAVNLVGDIPTLHSFLVTPQGSYMTDGIKNRMAAPNILSSLFKRINLN